MNEKKMHFIETFMQPADEGIPSHWVVRYAVDGDTFTSAKYFGSLSDAEQFERELLGDSHE